MLIKIMHLEEVKINLLLEMCDVSITVEHRDVAIKLDGEKFDNRW